MSEQFFKPIEEVKFGEVFHFQHSLRPFIIVDYDATEKVFIEVTTGNLYFDYQRQEEGLEFYPHCSVLMNGKIEWI